MEKLFNMAFVGAGFSLLSARFFYGLYDKEIFSNLLVFTLIPYFPGLSLLGAVVGGGVYLYLLSKKKDDSLPIARISDFFSIAFLISLPIGFLGFLLFSEKTMSLIKAGSQGLFYLTVFVAFLKFLLPRLLSGKIKEGTITLIFLIAFSLTSLSANIFPVGNFLKLINIENVSLLFLFIASIVSLLGKEKLIKILNSKGENNGT